MAASGLGGRRSRRRVSGVVGITVDPQLWAGAVWTGGILPMEGLAPAGAWRDEDVRQLARRFPPLAVSAVVVTVAAGMRRVVELARAEKVSRTRLRPRSPTLTSRYTTSLTTRRPRNRALTGRLHRGKQQTEAALEADFLDLAVNSSL